MDARINVLSDQIQKAEEAKQLQAQQSLNIEEQVKLLRQKLFGRKKEDRHEASDRPRDKSQVESSLFS
jgi:hypothetical protein